MTPVGGEKGILPGFQMWMERCRAEFLTETSVNGAKKATFVKKLEQQALQHTYANGLTNHVVFRPCSLTM